MNHYFRRAMIANGIVCALRLHQRVPEFGLSRCRLSLILQEDSAHYLIFSIIFLMTQPVTSKFNICLMHGFLHVDEWNSLRTDFWWYRI